MEPNVQYSTYSTLEVKEICRICLKMSPDKSSVWDAVFIIDIGNIQYVQMIMECTSVIVEKDNGFPEYICSDCSQQLANAYCFKLRCEKSNANLEQIFEILRASGKSCDYILIANFGKFPYIKVKNTTLEKNQENDLEITKNILENGESLIDENQIIPKIEEYFLDTNDADVTLETKVDIMPESNEGISGNAIMNKSELQNHLEITKNIIGNGESLTEENQIIPKVEEYYLDTNDADVTLESKVDIIPESDEGISGNAIKTESELENFASVDDSSSTTTYSNCLQKVENKNSLSSHVPKSPLTCDICNDIFRDNSSLIEHFYIHIKISLDFNDFDDECETYLCYPCDKSFSSAEKLIIHCSEHSQGKDYRCRKCNETFDEYKLLKKHTRKHEIGPYFCVKCLLSFNMINQVKIHEEVQHRASVVKDTFKCPLCEDIFKNLFQLKSHLKEHKADLYKCLVCFKLCNSIVKFKNHKREHNMCNLCSNCGKQFPRPLSLYAHIRLCHTKMNRVTCDVCNKTYSTAQSLKIHKRTHTKEKPYICSYCPYRSGYLGDLQKHIRIHTGDAPYACKFPNCDQRFKTASHRNIHYQQHTGERNYQCQICEMKFGRSDTLREHLRIHSSKKEFKCDICGKEFRRRHHVTIHKSRVHGLPKDKCSSRPS